MKKAKTFYLTPEETTALSLMLTAQHAQTPDGVDGVSLAIRIQKRRRITFNGLFATKNGMSPDNPGHGYRHPVDKLT
jgi:hypothetical protein